MATYKLVWDRHRLELGKRTCVMGVVNVTPDSFSDGGRFFKCDDAVAQGQKLFEEGADIIDIGGESTRPYSSSLSSKEECRRVLPVIEKLAQRISAPISIDTTKSTVAERAIEAGAAMINDISSFRLDPKIAGVAAESGVPVVLMHMKGTPKSMQVSPTYDDLLSEIKTFLVNAIARAEKMGIPKKNLIVDPGIGFGKTFQHNLVLINALTEFKTLDVPVLVGPSRKAFIRNLLKDKSTKDISPELPCVETGTQAAIAAAVLRGAHIVRTHDVANTVSTIKIIDAIKNAQYNPL
jgi:dihydropteroate synthase